MGVSFDYQNKNLLLFETQASLPKCAGQWLKVRDSAWTALKVDDLLLTGTAVENWVTGSTEAFLDTGGGPTFLQWGRNGEKDPFPPRKKDLTCPQLSFFHSDWKHNSDYADCECYYEKEVTFKLSGKGGQKTDAVFEQAEVHKIKNSPPLEDTPTLVTCRKANVGNGNWVNLGGVYFSLYPITFDYKTQEVCIQSGGDKQTLGPPSNGTGFCCYNDVSCPADAAVGDRPAGCNEIPHYCDTEEKCLADCGGASFCPVSSGPTPPPPPQEEGFCCYNDVPCPEGAEKGDKPQGCNEIPHYCDTADRCLGSCGGTAFCPL